MRGIVSGKRAGAWMAAGLVAILVCGCSKSEPASQNSSAKEPLGPEVTSNRVGDAGGAAPATKPASATPSVPSLGTQPVATPSVETAESTAGTMTPQPGADAGAASLKSRPEQGPAAQDTATTEMAQVGTGRASNHSGTLPAASNGSATAQAAKGPNGQRPVRPGNPDLIEFQPMVMDEPVTYIDLTEDRRHLVVTHQAAGAITIWDPWTLELVHTIETSSPRNVLCRGDKVYIAHANEGKISVFSAKEDWKRTDQFSVPMPNIVHLSAAQGKKFNGRILVTCHGPGRQGSYQGPTIFLLGSRHEPPVPLGDDAVASVSADGKLVMTQSSFNLSPSGMMTGFTYDDYLRGRRARNPLFRSGGTATSFLYQTQPGSYWIGVNLICGGVPVKPLKEDLGFCLIPDYADRVVYALTKGQLVAHRLNNVLSTIGQRNVKFPQDALKMFEGFPQTTMRQRDYLLDHPIGITRGDELRLFLVDMANNMVLTARTGSFFKGPSGEPSENSNETVPEDNPEQMAEAPEANPVPNGPTDRLELETDSYALTPGLNYKNLLLLQGRQLKVLGPDGLSVAKEIALPDRYDFIGEREDYYIAVRRQPVQMDVIDKETLEVLESATLGGDGPGPLDVTDLALHPQKPFSYVAVKAGIEIPRYRIIVFHEKSGEVTAPENLIGTWIEIDPTGRYLFAGYRDLLDGGRRLEITPEAQVIETPIVGNIDWLISYRISGREPRVYQVDLEAGGNGQGLRMSADGKRLSYLSHVGTPVGTRDLMGWVATDLERSPVRYELQGRGNPKLLAFHPTLDIVAIPGGPAALLFNRDRGNELPDQLDVPPGGLGGAEVIDLMFSPDGRHLVFVCNEGVEGRYLRTMPLKLSEEEMAIVEKGVVIPEVEEKERIIVPRKLIDALKPSEKTAALTPKDIGREYMSAVVTITTDEGFGTGFVVGQKGYVLTCAHVLPFDGEIQVRFSAANPGEPARTVTAEVVLKDELRDLALLKTDGSFDVTTVTIADGTSVEAGEVVTVIGNPGLGDAVLDHTLTTGVVSSPERKINGISHVQTSAAINPGNSGGPMFDSRGRVIGLVVLKANIEGTAFAVAASELRDFLMRATVDQAALEKLKEKEKAGAN